MRTILIGDVHGCLDELTALLAACGHRAEDRVVLVGDLVAKGPDSLGVVALAREQQFLGVRGNHDQRVLDLASPSALVDAERTGKGLVHARLAAALQPIDREYLDRLPLWLRLPDLGLLAVHGGVVPGLPLEAQDRDDLMNLRSIDAAGRPSRRVDGGVPWASLWPGPEHVVFGHDAMRGLQLHPHATGLDTGCVYGGRLTALIVPGFQRVSVEARRAYAPRRG